MPLHLQSFVQFARPFEYSKQVPKFGLCDRLSSTHGGLLHCISMLSCTGSLKIEILTMCQLHPHALTMKITIKILIAWKFPNDISFTEENM